MITSVHDNSAANRYEIHVDGQLVGFSEYKLGAGRIAFTHTETSETFRGRGLARRLVVHELADARTRGLAVLPFCPYVRKVIAEALDTYLDLVPAKDRERFKLPAATRTESAGA